MDPIYCLLLFARLLPLWNKEGLTHYHHPCHYSNYHGNVWSWWKTIYLVEHGQNTFSPDEYKRHPSVDAECELPCEQSDPQHFVLVHLHELSFYWLPHLSHLGRNRLSKPHSLARRKSSYSSCLDCPLSLLFVGLQEFLLRRKISYSSQLLREKLVEGLVSAHIGEPRRSYHFIDKWVWPEIY